ncbi:type II toxin-antitoxin system VapC family toxin [Chelativorans alearense]|uniref:type II toxin-antitoxin system VapC family toxin n=1 Tax=Chelativorans alearense TaxID=2681495 RepID=UPI0013D8CF1A|nr:type II toxin-antitoxin system VapC family toxin [Chelativorans alearense]
MILLDTNVISEVLSRRPHKTAIRWLDEQEEADLLLCPVVLAELYFGAYLVREVERHEMLLENIALIRRRFAGRVLPFGDLPSEIYGRITTSRQIAGQRMETKDAMIAAICLAHGAALATRNTRDFEGLDLTLVNPFEAGA